MQRNLASLCVLLALLLSGCATQTLWEADHFNSFREPAKPSHLQIFQGKQPDKALVVYDQHKESAGTRVSRRAYWVKTNEDSPSNPHKPKFVSLSKTNGLSALPLLASPAAAGLSVVSTNEQSFRFYMDANETGAHELPSYSSVGGRAKQVALTPLTVATDATIVGGFLGVWWLSSGNFTWQP